MPTDTEQPPPPPPPPQGAEQQGEGIQQAEGNNDQAGNFYYNYLCKFYSKFSKKLSIQTYFMELSYINTFL